MSKPLRVSLVISAITISENSRRLELSISKNTPHGRWGQGPGSVDPRFPTGLPFPVPQILEFVAFGDSGKFFQQFSRNFPGTFLQNSRKDPRNSHSLLEFSDKLTGLGTRTSFSASPFLALPFQTLSNGGLERCLM